MKTFNKYISESINEALINKNTKISTYNYFPKTKEELKRIIKDKIAKMVSQKSSNLYLDDIDVSKIDDMNSLFMGIPGSLNIKKIDVTGWNTSKVESMGYMFGLLNNLKEISGIEDFHTENVERMSYMFLECKKLKKINLSNWNIKKVTSLSGMFKDCQRLTEIIGLENLKTDVLLYTNDMFYNCFKLEKIDINNWNTSNLFSTANMFRNCKKLTDVKIGKIDTSHIASMESMFENCQSLVNIDDLSNWDLQALSTFKKMFKKCYNLIKIKGLDNWFKGNRQQRKYMDEMFAECVNLKDIGDIDYWRFIDSKKDMFKNTNIDNIPKWY